MEWLAVGAAAGAAAVGVAWFAATRRRADRLGEARAAIDGLTERLRIAGEERHVRELILGSMEEGVLLFAPDGATGFANAAAARHLGLTPTGLTGLAPAALRRAVHHALEEPGPVTVEVEVGSPGRWLRGSAVRVGDERAALLVLRDVTEARRVDAVRRDFVANASHELKTPAASIRAAAETIRGAADDDPSVIPRFAEQLEREAVRLARIVSDLLDLSRLESGSERVDLVPFDAIVREEAARFEPAADRAGIALSVDVRPTPAIRGSSQDLALLVRNLVDNAIRYTPAGGRVEVVLEPAGAGLSLRVADTGPGIPSRDLDRIFERFYRVDRARSRETGGTGLGLSIVRHVTENHGGTVTVRSELGRGATFEVRLPTEPPAEEANEAGGATAEARRAR